MISEERILKVLRAPHISEKSTNNAEANNTIVFKVAKDATKAEIKALWNKGWECLFQALEPLDEDDLEKIIYIRNHGHTVTEAINRQTMHYAYHIGQIVFLGKLLKGENWQSLSIPKGKSSAYNQAKFSKDKTRRHFTEDL